MKVIRNAKVDRTVVNTAPLKNFQFERLGYFCVDPSSTNSQVSDESEFVASLQ